MSKLNDTRCFLRARLAAACLVAAACLCSCGDGQEEDAPSPATTAPAAPSAAAKQADKINRAHEAVYEQLMENIAPLVTDRASTVAEFNEPTKVFLESLQAYYDAIASAPPSAERAHIARRIADVMSSLRSYAKGYEAFQRAQADLDALPQSERDSVAGKRLQSAIWTGAGLCLINQNRATDALPYYEKALASDLSVLREVGPAEGEALPTGSIPPDVSRAVADALGSYRCLGECQLEAGDPEEARDTYRKGLQLMEELKQLDTSSAMGIAFVKLISAQGDLENRCGRDREALSAWVQAARLCNTIISKSGRAATKAQARSCFIRLNPLIKEKSQQLRAAAADDAEAAREAEEAARAAEEADRAQAEEEARAAEEAAKAEREAAQRAAEAQKNKSKSQNRRNRR